MKTSTFEKRHKALQTEAKALAAELKPLVKRYKSICRKACSLGQRVDNDKQLYKYIPERDDVDTDGWNIHVLFRLNAFEDAGDLMTGVINTLLNFVDEPFSKKI